MTFGSVCSGIEAASVAWTPLGWSAAWVAEIEAFPCAVLRHHYPEVENLGDFTKIRNVGSVDVLVGGTPCQSFSVAGKRAGLDDPRGHLTLEFLALAGRLRPRWIAWENVPGVLSDDGGRTFGTFLELLGQLGYGFAYRILDAQHFGVPQRRRRVFVVGHLGDWRRAAAVLFERFSLSGHPTPRRETRQSFTHDIAPSLTSSGRGVERGGDSRGQDPVIAMALNAKGGSGRCDGESETFVTAPLTRSPYADNEARESLLVPISLGLGSDVLYANDLAQPVTTRNGDPGTVAIPILEAGARTGNSTTDLRAGIGIGEPGDPMFTLQSGKQHAIGFSCKDYGVDVGDIAPAVALAIRGRDGTPQIEMGDEVANAILTPNGGRGGIGVGATLQGMAVRRLTPRECERLQGFPDNYTQVPFRNKPAADGPRYKALGNSMAVPVMSWIGERIQEVEAHS